MAYRVSAKAQALDTADIQQLPAAQPKLQKRQQLPQRRAGPVTVQVLTSTHQTVAPSGNCSDHAQACYWLGKLASTLISR